MGITNLLLSAVTAIADPTYVDGQVAPLSINADGRLRVASKPGYFAPTSAPLAAAGSQLALDVTDASNVVIHVKNTGTAVMAAGVFVFEGSIDSTNGIDGTWFSIQAVRSNANTIEVQSPTLSLGIGAGATWSWEASVNACRWIRIRCTVAVTASSIATWTIIRGTYATEPIPAIQPNVVSGAVTANLPAGTNFALTAAATTNQTLIKSAAGVLNEITIFNPTANPIYVKLFNKATAPVAGTDVPLMVLVVPAMSGVEREFGPTGKRFAAGLGLAITGAAVSTDATAILAGPLVSATYI